ncbi:MAG TPA: transcription termination/antitermination protein NusA [Firmicutes bacterium]|uniref:Transcription termination/antitermination protein NusA n=1 Tax=Capillibacterium thermochitinicola TaxID=2699427 RepID=A0A8J6LNN2_9FIRM|nr:transcription termination factor NusA [Capillibacterium thermochitinicola]MBA2133848.1 transcription termination/antitermination protein NusA [Capillibacterium thermochitinicola]HHW11643.1 transcription termination/antitermination protein NusA [Bacillota bacterium]
MNRELIEALNMVEREKGIAKEILIEAIESAILSAYKKDQGKSSNLKVVLDPETGEFHIYTYKEVVMEVEDENTQINLAAAKAINPSYQLKDLVEFEIFPKEFGRIAAQTAKQIIVQRIREAERTMIYNEYSSRVDDLITGTVRRFEQKTVYVDLGKTEAILPPHEQIPGERFEHGARIKAYLAEVKKGSKGPQIILSRARSGFLKRLLEFEVPEIQEGIVEIKNIAREPGARSKVAVYSKFENVDPIGACVGAKGSRVQMVVRELKGEKIDLVLWDEDPARYITRALSPAKVTEVKLLPSKKSSIVIVPDNQLSLAIGKEGQNARLAARLTGWKVDIKSESQAEECREEIEALLAEEESYQEETYDWEEVLGTGEELTELTGEDLEAEEQTDEAWDEEEELWEETDLPADDEVEEPDFTPDEDEEAEEDFIREEPKKKKSKKRAKQRVKEFLDEVEEGFDLFKDASADSEPEVAVEDDSELVFTEEGGSGFTIGQLLSEELKKKFKLSEEEKKKK